VGGKHLKSSPTEELRHKTTKKNRRESGGKKRFKALQAMGTLVKKKGIDRELGEKKERFSPPLGIEVRGGRRGGREEFCRGRDQLSI